MHIMKNLRSKLVGILGTVIVHLIAAIIFMSFQIHKLKIDRSDEFVVEFVPVESDEEENLIELPASSIESILQGDEELLNIARNLASRPDVKIDPADYIDKVKEELIKSGQLTRDNYIDEQKRLLEQSGDEKLAYERDAENQQKDEIEQDSREMASNYQGPTRIYYDLTGRHHMYLPIPIYKCQGSGKVVLSILVNQKGIVEEAKIIETVSTASDPCLVETALKTALISRFNPDIKSPKIQPGTLTYHFVAQ